MSIKKVAWILMIFAAMAMVGCASRQSADYYQRGQAQQVQTVMLGEIVAIRDVQIEGTKTPTGTIVGAIMGGVLGSMIGGGKGKTLATVAGAAAGGLGGSAIEEGVTKKPGYELTITLDKGDTIAIVQEVDVYFRVGDRVRVIKNPDGLARVTHL
jgi:outer membrane lipoprotein SlyB